MVKLIHKPGKAVYLCTACNLTYPTRSWAEKCEQWCTEKHSCNLEIIKHAHSS